MAEKPASNYQKWTFGRVLSIALAVRLFLVFYAKIHDYLFEVSFTDIDYRVFTDAARLVAQGKSPFLRATYRYTPLIAWLLVPTVVVPDFGKILFCIIDCLTGWLMFRLCVSDTEVVSGMAKGGLRASKSEASVVSAMFGVSVFWLFNPFVAIISARGSSDSMVCTAVLLTMLLLKRKKIVAAAIAHGALAIHLKIYPIIYLPSVFLYIAALADQSLPKKTLSNDPLSTYEKLKRFVGRCLTNRMGHIYVMVSLLFFIVTVAVGQLCYGERFVEEFLLYHLHRRDVRHNFSPYFYPMYLAVESSAEWTKWLSWGAFVPQLVSISFFAAKYHEDLPFCWFLTTFAFVAFNKVCTSQYFIWYLCYLPLVYDRINIGWGRAIWLTALWFGAQAVWLLLAYLFEFRGWATLPYVWLASLLFLLTNCYLMAQLIAKYDPRKNSSAIEKISENTKKIR